MGNIYLLPGTTPNINKTIRGHVERDFFLKYFTTDDWNRVTDNGKNTAHCWAFSTNSIALYNPMEIGDEVLISERKTGLFNYYGKVVHKQANRGFGDAQWGINGNTHWDYIFFLGDIKEISLNKKQLTIDELGFDENFRLSGPHRLRDEKLIKMINFLDRERIGE